jgi:hypothetical protein
MEEEQLVKVVFDPNANYSNFSEWVQGRSKVEEDFWLQLLNKKEHTESDFELIAKKSIELYCLDMDIDAVPLGEEFIRNIINEFVVLFFMHRLQSQGYVTVHGTLCFGLNVRYETTEKGRHFADTNFADSDIEGLKGKSIRD